MKDIYKYIKQELRKTVLKTYNLECVIELETPKDVNHGDLSSNIAMQITKELKKNPIEIAEEIVKNFNKKDFIEKIVVAKPGFINFIFSKKILKDVVEVVLSQKEIYGKSDVGVGKKVMIEFGQPNTHKAFHVGHLKSAISGLSMVKLHENLGFDVIKANFFGDVGMQVAKPTWGFIQKGKPEDFDTWNVHEQMRYIDECYAFGSQKFKDDKKVEEEIRQINKDIYANKDTKEVKIYKYLKEISLKHQNDIWKSLGIVFNREYPESEVYKDAIKIVNQYKDQVFEKSEGAIVYKGEKIGLTNWVFLTSEGNPTYSSKDLALAYKKFEEYPDLYKGIVTTSVEIKDYFKVVIHVLGIIKPETKGRYFHLPFGWMLRGGKKFSSRMGGSIKGMDILTEVKSKSEEKVRELNEYSEEEIQNIINAVANAGLKFLILSHEFHKNFSYDPDQFLSFTGFSGPYILYTYARAKSILRKSTKIKTIQQPEYKHTLEIEVIKLLTQYPDIAFNAGMQITPHLIANYLYNLASKFNQFYTECPVLNAESEEVKISRLKLVEATSIVLKNGLNLLGIETVEKM